MQPVGRNWHPKLGSSLKTDAQPKPTAFKQLSSSYQQFSAGSLQDRPVKRRQKPHGITGMFAAAKSSLPTCSSYTFPKFDQNREDDAPAPIKITKFSNFPRQGARAQNGWDFSDISDGRDKFQQQPTIESTRRPSVPEVQRYNSDDEKQGIPTISAENPPKRPILPWLRKLDSQEETEQTPREIEKKPLGFEKSIERFSKRFDKKKLLPRIPLQNHTKTTMGTVERAVVAVALARLDSGEPPKAFPVYELLLERSDWLMFNEEMNDEEDYPPDDPFFSREDISSDVEEYEQEMELTNIPTYERPKDPREKEEKEQDLDVFKDLAERDQSDSQEDFFDNVFSPRTPDKSPEFPTFSQYCAKLNARKRTTPSEDFPLPYGPSTSNYNPFDESPSPKNSNSSSKFSFG
ncbi:unnamed protein product [Caenorhabditis sp. 36 PRJEB53466]|nr:unnamed protein product [Caenorhabditis sp. 36 PRJEB53466]